MLVKVTRATILLGSISLDVYQMPGGEYRLSQSGVAEAIGLNKSWFSRLHKSAPRQLESLRSKGFTGCTQQVSIDKSKAKTLSIADATKVWSLFARHGNDAAFDLMEACAAEAIERRADAAFG